MNKPLPTRPNETLVKHKVFAQVAPPFFRSRIR